MKVAIVHELLTMKGGAERVVRILANMFPDAPIYTLLYNEKRLGHWFPKERVRPAKIPFPYSLLPTPCKYNHHLHLPHFARTVEQWDFSDYDLVISSSSAFAHGIITNGNPKHLCYVHSPARYLWDRTHDVLDRIEGSSCTGPLLRRGAERLFHKLRVWDAEVAPRPDMLLAASTEVQHRIHRYWKRESTVVYPPIDDHWFTQNPSLPIAKSSSYYLIISTLAPYKRIDLAIEAANRGGFPLKIVGEGADRSRLEKLAGPTVEFLGYQPGGALHELLSAAKALIVPGDEDFGLTPVEAMSQGTPVIAFRKGGPLETVTDGVTGSFFSEPTVHSLLDAVEKFDPHMYRSESCRETAEKFSSERFKREIDGAIGKLI